MAVFKAKDISFELNRTYVMGILNVTPDSFSDGGSYFDTLQAVKRAKEMLEEGVDIIDIGAQSTRPGYMEIPPDEEWARLEPVLKTLLGETEAVISVDTYFPWVAEKAADAGAHIINDVTGFKPEMIEAVKARNCGLVVMHPCGFERGDILRDVKQFFENKLDELTRNGIDKERICFDPGVGFGKTYEENLQLIACTEKIKIKDVCYLLAASRKRVIGTAGGEADPGSRMPGTVAAHTVGIIGGADIIRVHDTKAAVQAARVADSLKGVLNG